MCYGSGCPYEIVGGENSGECRKPRMAFCPDSYSDEESDDEIEE